MLTLRDFFNLPLVDEIMQRIIAEDGGLIAVAGLDPRPLFKSTPGAGFLPSGRSTIFNILLDELLAARPGARGIIVTADKNALRIPRSIWRQISWAMVQTQHSYRERILEAIQRHPYLLIIDQLDAETTALAFEAVQRGVRVLSQIDTIFRGAEIIRYLSAQQAHDVRAAQVEYFKNLLWIFSVQRMEKLCPRCKQRITLTPFQSAKLNVLLVGLDQVEHPLTRAWIQDLCRRAVTAEVGTFFKAVGCSECHFSGRQGDVAICDIFRSEAPPVSFEQPDLLPLQAYLLHLALNGQVALEDVFQYETNLLYRTFNLLNAREKALGGSNITLESKLAELEAAHRVSEQRTRALISLQDIAKSLIASNDLDDLASRVCRYACELCGADRAILYLFRSEEVAEVLAVGGWEARLAHQQLPASELPKTGSGSEPLLFNHWPPGVPLPLSAEKSVTLRCGLGIPLVAQHRQVGMMIIHASQKSQFAPGEIAMLQTFAIQAALALQRAGLVDELRAKIAELEAAQDELSKKERMEREMELARQVQQSVLPRAFPQVAGYRFAARNEPARQVGGDFYDIFLLDADHFGLAVADVSGKGMPAALYMALARSLLLAEARRGGSPVDVLASVNQLLLELSESQMFVTVFYGVVSRSEQKMIYARAGQDRPFLLHNNSIEELSGDGIPLGIFSSHELNLTEEVLKLAPGDRLVLYTDGLTDVVSPQGDFFSREQLMALVQSYANLGGNDLCAVVFTELNQFQSNAEQFDDMTMVIVDVDEKNI